MFRTHGGLVVSYDMDLWPRLRLRQTSFNKVKQVPYQSYKSFVKMQVTL